MDLYERQVDLGIIREQRVAIVGCGGVGVWAGLAIALGGVEELALFDADQLSLNNLNRLPYPASEIGKPKSLALASWLGMLRPDLMVDARGMFDPILHRLSPDGHSYNWVVCCTDSLKSRRECYKWAQEMGAEYLELGADGERWTLSPKPPEFSTDLENDAGYATVPVHIGPCMMAGAAAAYYVLHGRTPDVSHYGDWHSPSAEYNEKWLKLGTNLESSLAFEIQASLENEEPMVSEVEADGADGDMIAEAYRLAREAENEQA